MKIYEVHETGGEYEDYFDHIVARYLTKESAETKKSELIKAYKANMEQYEKCRLCPLSGSIYATEAEFENTKKELEYYDPCVKEAISCPCGWTKGFIVDCFYCSLQEEVEYYIEEAEVIEE